MSVPRKPTGVAAQLAKRESNKDIPQFFRLMPDVAFVLKHAKHGAHRGVTGRVGHGGFHFRRRRFAALVENVHDLPLAPAQPGCWLHHRISCWIISNML